MFVRINTLIRKFSKRSDVVQTVLFKIYCIFCTMPPCGSIRPYNLGTLCKLRSSYTKCIKLFFSLNAAIISLHFDKRRDT